MQGTAPTPPATADIKNSEVRFQVQLGGYQAFFVLLRLLQAVVRLFKICTGILHVLIEKQSVKRITDIIMVSNLSPRPGNGIILLKAPEFDGYSAYQALKWMTVKPLFIKKIEFHEVTYTAAFESQASVHVGLAEVQPGVEEYLVIQRGLAECQGSAWSRFTGKYMLLAASINNFQGTDADKAP